MDLKSMSAAATVGEALQTSGITLENLDYSLPSEDSPLPSDGKIRVVRVREEVLVQQQSIPYKVVYQADDTLELDQQNVVTAGQYGISVSRIIVHFEDGEETSRTTEDSVNLVDPVDQKIAYGTKIVYHTLDTPDGQITYYRAVTVFATSYSPCRSAPADGSSSCISGTASGVKVQKGVIATTVAWYSLFAGDKLYVPDYGVGTIADTGGGISGKNWIDLGFSDSDWQQWSRWVTVYFLAPAPANVPGVLP
jgi:3D (Asp-Asp-Asp) domain-containing protein